MAYFTILWYLLEIIPIFQHRETISKTTNSEAVMTEQEIEEGFR